MIQELPDPFIEREPTSDPIWRRARRFLGKGKRRILRLLEKTDHSREPSEAQTPQVPPPVIGYTAGATGELSRRGLITYVAWPFYAEAEKFPAHSNGLQALEIARAFNRLGYIVDFVDWQDTTFVPTARYDVFFGMHHNFERFLPYLDETTVKIYYGTGAYWAFEIAAEQARVEGLRRRRGVELKLPIRLGENNWVQIADAVVVIGNQFTLGTYRPYNSRLFAIDNSAVPTAEPDLNNKDFASARQNFLWFGSSGLLHKGLDLVLEAFAELRDLHLWICGPLQSADERDFIRVYRRELFHTPNIHPIGWVNMHSEQFRLLTDRCAFTVLASCSEAMATAILNCMYRGLIPLISREVGLDTDGFGMTLDESSVDKIQQAVVELATLSPDICRQMATEAFRQATTRYSLESFRQNIECVLRVILSES